MSSYRPTRGAFLALVASTALLACQSVRQHALPPPPLPEHTVHTVRHHGRWIDVDTRAETLTVYVNDTPLRVFDNIAWGVGGVGIKTRRGDGVTPVGVFRLFPVHRKSKFNLFFPINYPTLDYAARGLAEGLLSPEQYLAIAEAHRVGRMPPQDLPVGGLLGLHGVGQGSLEVHRRINWTEGCIALDNTQIRALQRLIVPAMVVEIR